MTERTSGVPGQIPRERILKDNVALHRLEAPSYDSTHHEIFNSFEQRRVRRILRRCVGHIQSDVRLALDFGCGTGNISTKLTRMGFRVVGADLSSEMLAVMRGNLTPTEVADQIMAIGECLPFRRGLFSLIASYSTLHHLPDYLAVARELADLLCPGGVLLLDHEASANGQHWSPGLAYRLYKRLCDLETGLHDRLNATVRPGLSYGLAEYHGDPERPVRWDAIIEALQDDGLDILEVSQYLLHRTRYWNPMHPILSFGLHDTQSLVARKPA